MEKIEIKSTFGNILFEFEKENNTVKDTVLEAIRSGADLRGADLRGADLSGVNLYEVDLHGADLRGVDLSGANLSRAYLRRANLRCASFYGADLYDADFCDADLYGANLSGANLYGTNLRDAKNTPFIPTYLPEGEFIAWKKLPNDLIVKLKIMEDSKRSRANGDKCRCDKALVVEFQNVGGTKSKVEKYISNQYAKCVYEVGKIVEADEWDEDRFNECSHGIHFFIDRQSAVDY